MAYGRLKSLTGRLHNDKDLLQCYSDIIQRQLDLGIIERAIENTEVGSAVISPTKATTKVRIVYDASAKARKGIPCLNDCLYREPDMLPNLCGLVIRFHTKRIGILADIEKAFV